jgi:spermidine synthase
MITHVPLFAHPAPREVLIIGGGDCGALTEVLKHPEVERCTMCEIDSMVVETTRKHLPALTAGLDDPRANLLFKDGQAFIEAGDEKYDLIILDLSDPVGPAADLFQKDFHRKVHDRLTENGIMVAQSESPYYNQETVKSMFANLRDIFPLVRMYTCFMPIYPSGLWSFAFCSRGPDPLGDFDEARWDKLGLSTQYYNPECHRGSFALPRFIRNLVDPA